MIVNADDFGYSESITEAILVSMQRGYVHRTTLMVNMPDADRAVARAREMGLADRIGLHFNVTLGKPLTLQMAQSRFCSTGEFNHLGTIGHRYFLNYDSSATEALKAEIRAQIEKFLSYRLPLLHFDSHNHVHFRLPIARVVFPLLREYGFKTIRRPYNIGMGGGVASIGKRLRNALFAAEQKKFGLKSARWFGNVGRWNRDDIEIMVHPRYDNRGNLVNCEDYRSGEGVPMKDVAEMLGIVS